VGRLFLAVATLFGLGLSPFGVDVGAARAKPTADPEAVADRAAQSIRDRCVRVRPVDARCRVAMRAGRPGEAVQVDRVADVRGAQGALRTIPSA
jgi:hypothetical protein